jgi:hypothetical protein
VFPNQVANLPGGGTVTVQAVPTTVALGPDGNYYVGQLTGFSFVVGAANIYRVPAGGGTPQVVYSGFTNIIDIAFAPDGSLYVLQITANGIPAFNPGKLVHVALDGTRTEIAAGQLIAPGGIAVGDDGALYVTNLSISSTVGSVLKIEPDPMGSTSHIERRSKTKTAYLLPNKPLTDVVNLTTKPNYTPVTRPGLSALPSNTDLEMCGLDPGR